MAVRSETAVEQYHLNSTWVGCGGLVVVGGRSSVVRALAAQASDLGSIPDDFTIAFHIPSWPVYSKTSYS